MKSFILIAVLFCLAVAYAQENDSLEIVSRAEWGAKSPRRAPQALAVQPASHVLIAHTAGGFCKERHGCYMHLRNVQALNVQQSGFNDIVYNFMLGGDGLVYEGRGFGVAGQHSPGYDNRSIAVAFVGDFEYRKPTEAQVQALRDLLAYGVRSGKIAADYKLVAQKQVVANTKSPGKQVYDIIENFEHFSLA